jgi:GMP synthase (glutamine-hydrolysing)
MSETVYVFQHVECEDLGSFAAVLGQHGLIPRYVRLFAGDAIPADSDAARALIILGGPMSVNDAAKLPYLNGETAMLRRALASQQPVLGVCLGSQLLAAAAGSRVFPAARPEIGWGPISLTVEGRHDAVFAALQPEENVFHWHGETFDLPKGATRLAFSALTMNQAFRIGAHAYGLQFHLEVDAEMVRQWSQEYAADLGAGAAELGEQLAAEAGRRQARLRSVASQVLGRFLEVTSVHSGRET